MDSDEIAVECVSGFCCGKQISAQGAYESAAQVMGAAAAAREAVGAIVFDFYRDDHEQLIRRVRDALSEEAFNRKWTEGHVLPFADAIDYALSGIKSM